MSNLKLAPVTPLVFAGRVQAMPGDGRPTAIFKQPLHGEIEVTPLGIVGDHQADLKNHGGPEKAVHFYPADRYALLAAHFDAVADAMQPGAMGENLSAAGVGERDVCIGDVFAFGAARLQVCQPRTPCWKIDARHGVDGMAAFIEQRGIAGWYYRVLVPGRAQVGAALTLDSREPDAISVADFSALRGITRPDLALLQRLVDLPALASDWRRRLHKRLVRLREHGG